MKTLQHIIKGSLIWLPFFVYMLGISAVADAVVVPYEVSKKGRIIVPVTVGDKGEHLFMLDTGSNATVIFQTGALMLNLSAVGHQTMRVMTATGISEEPVYKLGLITFGPTVKHIAQTIALSETEDANLVGILGLDMIYGQVIEFDKKEREIIFHDTANAFEGDKFWREIPMADVQGAALVVTAKIGSLDVMGLIDTGATISVINMPAFHALQKPLSKMDVDMKERRIAAAAGKVSAAAIVVSRLKLGNVAYRNLTLTAANLPIFNYIGMGSTPGMIIGMDTLRHHSMVLDYKRKRFFITK